MKDTSSSRHEMQQVQAYIKAVIIRKLTFSEAAAAEAPGSEAAAPDLSALFSLLTCRT